MENEAGLQISFPKFSKTSSTVTSAEEISKQNSFKISIPNDNKARDTPETTKVTSVETRLTNMESGFLKNSNNMAMLNSNVRSFVKQTKQ